MEPKDQSVANAQGEREVQGEVASLQKALEECRTEQQSWKEKFLQINADLQNLQRRFTREQAQWISTAQAKLLTDLLPIIDDFDRAIQQVGDNKSGDVQGFRLMYHAFHKFLKEHGVQEFTEYKTFDPEIHEALMQVKSDAHNSGDIVSVLRKGYRLNGSLLRIAQVSVAE